MKIKFATHRPSQSDNKKYEYLKGKNILTNILFNQVPADEPQFFHCVCEYRRPKSQRGFAFGTALNYETAFSIALHEAIERYCYSNYETKSFIKSTYKELGIQAVDPKRFIPFSSKQLERPEFAKFRFDDKSLFSWVKAYSLTRKTSSFIPASLVYGDYDPDENSEPTIRFHSSTGTACAETRKEAIYKGICEVVERDSYMISFLNHVPLTRLALPSTNDLQKLLRKITRYELEIRIFQINLDTPVTTFLSMLIDRTGSGPAICVGLGADLNHTKAIKSSLMEAVRHHFIGRDRFFLNSYKNTFPKESQKWFLFEKQRFWSMPHATILMEDFLKSSLKPLVERNFIDEKFNPDIVDSLVKSLSKLNFEVFVVDLTTNEIKKAGLSVMKVIIPELIPYWKDERIPYQGFDRLSQFKGKQLKHGHAISTIINANFSAHPFY